MERVERVTIALIMAFTICFVFTQIRGCQSDETSYWAKRSEVLNGK